MSYINEYTCDGCGKKADGDLTPEGWSFDGKDLCPDCNPNSRRNQPVEQRHGDASRKEKP